MSKIEEYKTRLAEAEDAQELFHLCSEVIGHLERVETVMVEEIRTVKRQLKDLREATSSPLV